MDNDFSNRMMTFSIFCLILMALTWVIGLFLELLDFKIMDNKRFLILLFLFFALSIIFALFSWLDAMRDDFR